MSKVFARYTVIGDSEDIGAFEAVMRHIDKCIMLGEGRDITICVDGDGSASLKFYREKIEAEELKDLDGEATRIEYLDYPDEIRDKVMAGEDVELGVGTMKGDGSGEYCIGE